MPRLPRDLSGADLIRALSRVGYSVTRQTGSHVRLTCTTAAGEQHLTVPRHPALRTGTLGGILAAAAAQLEMSKDELQEKLFG